PSTCRRSCGGWKSWRGAERVYASRRRRPLPQKLQHLHVPGVRRRIVRGDFRMLLRCLQDQGDAARPAIRQQPSERLAADLAFPQERVPIPVGAELPFAVVEMEEGGRLAGLLLELVQDTADRLGRLAQVVA